MTVGTFDFELARPGADWWAWIEVQGWGRRTGATNAGRRRAYRISQRHPYDLGAAATDCDCYFDGLQELEDIVEIRINLKEGTTELDGGAFTLLDGPLRQVGGAPAHGWGDDAITDLLVGTRAPASEWSLAAAVARSTSGAADTWTLASTAGLAAGAAVWIGEEVAICTAVPGGGGAGTIDVLRGMYNTEANAHATRAAGGDGALYDRPQFNRDREVRLYVSFIDHATGTPLAITGGTDDRGEAVLAWRGTLTNWRPGASISEYTLMVRSACGRLHRTLGREQLRGTVPTPLESHDGDVNVRIQGGEIPFTIQRPEGEGVASDPGYQPVAGVQTFHARLGDELVEVQYQTADGQYVITGRALLGTPTAAWDAQQNGNELPFWDVLLSHPAPGGANKRYFLDAAGNPFSHPLLVALALMTSTGTAGANGDWDCLPRKWSAGIPAALIDTQRWLDLAEATAGLSYPRLCLGRDGKPFQLARFIDEELLGPLGFFRYPDAQGRISVGALREFYANDSWPALDEDDTVEDDGGPGVEPEGQLDQTVTRQSWSYDFDFVKQRPRQALIYRHPQAIDRDCDDSAIERQLTGLEPSADAAYVIKSMAVSFGRWFVDPPPRYVVPVHMDALRLAVTDGIRLTDALLPNPYTGIRGLTAMPCAVLSRRLAWSRNRIILRCLPLGTYNVKRWAPSGTVTAENPATFVLTLNPNDFTKADGPIGVPARDAADWSVGARAMLIDPTGAVLCDNAPTVAGVEAAGVNTLTLDGRFTLAGVPVSAVGNIVTYCHYQGGAAPVAAWTAAMLLRAVQADDATGLLPNGDAAVVYGGL